MSQYSEMVGSFIRTGNFPFEADFIFPNETSLKEFYSDPINKTLLYKGWLKLVEDDGSGQQALYWVAKKQTNDELEFKKLISYNTSEEFEHGLEDLQKKLDQEIQDRKTADDAIYGTTNHTEVPDNLNSLLEIANAILELQQAQAGTDALKEELKATVGTDQDDIKAYLQTLDYPSLTAVSEKLHQFFDTVDPDDPSINTFKELQSFLQGINDTDTLKGLLDNLLEDSLNSILGDPLPTEPFRTLRGVEDFVREFKSDSENYDQNLQTELDQTQVGVGLSGDGSFSPDQETYYLKEATSIMNALKILDSLINQAINNCNLEVEDTNTVDLTINKQVDKTILSADIKVSTQVGNGIQSKSDGLYYKLETEYDNGILTVKVNDNIISQHTIGLSTIVEEAEYDPDQEALVIVFKLLNGDKQTLTIPVGSLIREWVVDNSYPTKVVELTKEEVLGGGPDKLSADVRLYSDQYQILEKKDNTLYVKGTTDNIKHNDQKLNEFLNNLQNTGSSINEALQQEIQRAQAAESALDEKIIQETSRAQQEEAAIKSSVTSLTETVNNNTSAINDTKSQLEAEIQRAQAAEQANKTAIDQEVQRATQQEAAIQSNLDDHIKDYNNPHKVTKNQVGLDRVDNTSDLEKTISIATQNALNEKADISYVNSQLDTKAPIDSPVFKGNPQVENPPEQGDNSNRIPTTNWVIQTISNSVGGDLSGHITDYNNPHRVTAEQVGLGNVDNTSDLDKPVSNATQEIISNLKIELEEKITSTGGDLSGHIEDFNNPHKVTAEQVGAYSKEESDELLKDKADLVDGKIPSDLLPSSTQNAIYYAGKWDASTNSPSLQPDDKVNIGAQYLVTTGGSFNGIQFKPNDFIQNVDGSWVKVDNNNLITSVNNKTGDIVIGIDDIDGLQDIINSKADISDIYSKSEIDEIVNNISDSTQTDLTQITQNLEEITNNITNLEDNKADLVEGKIPETQLPDSVLGCVKYKGEWDATNNNPALSNTDQGKEGWYYVVSEAGRQFGTNFKVGDWVVNSGGKWTKVNNADAVSSVNGMTGEVIINIEDIPGLEDAINTGGSGLDSHITDYNNPHRVTKGQIGLDKVENYSPAEMPISNAVQTEITRIDNKLSESGTDLSAHIKDYNNPHKVTKAQVGLDKVDNTSDLEKPISAAVQEALYQIKLDATNYATKDQLNDHINDRMNPHQVTAAQVGLGNVDNTSDLDKPISNATQKALDQKANINHTHTMTDISDLESSPIIKDFVDNLAELPESAAGGDKYIVKTQVGSGTTRYTLAEYDGATGTWKQKLLSTGTIASIIGGDVYKLTSEGPQRILDADDYNYFYNKVWEETEDLIQSIEWDDSVSDKIRLKITTKKSYNTPNTDEAIQPDVTPKVSYIDIEKERFMSSAYSRPATAEDVENGYASKEGVPVLVIELTTGDEVVIDLTDTLNIYDPVATSSINMSVSDWTGSAETSYKISASLKIAENSDAVKLVDNGSTGVYARLDKKNSNSIELVDDGSLSANLILDNSINNTSDILLSIGSSGLSAKFVWGEYE